MPSPSTALSTLRPDLAGSFMEFELEMLQSGFIATQVLPVIETQKQSGPFGKIPVEQLLKERVTNRAPGAGYARGNFTFTTDSFACEEHGAEEPVDDSEAEMYADYFDAEQVCAARARRAVMVNMEKRVAAAVFNATTWTSYTSAITNEWDDIANAVPITDVETAAQAVWGQCGAWPNALVVNRKVFRNLRRCAQITDLLKYQGFQDVRPGNITVQALAQVFDLAFILVAGGTRDSANEGQATTFASVWSDEYAMVCRVATTRDIQEPCVGRIFHWGADGSEIGGMMETYRDETVRSDVVRCRHQVDEKILYVEAGYLLSNVTT